MLKKFIFVFVLILGPALMSHGENTDMKPCFVPPDDKILLIIGQDRQTIDEYVRDISVIPGGFAVYTSIQKLEGIAMAIDCSGGIQHWQHIVDTYPHSALQIGLWMVDGLDGITDGIYDFNIHELGKWLISTKRPVYLRIGYEFDWSGNHYDPGKYQKAFRHIVDKFREMGIQNVAYVWHSAASDNSRPFMDWYPGDEYVDWFAVSFFYEDQKPYLDEMGKLARKHNKPLMIAESTPYGFGTINAKMVWKKWFQYCFEYMKKYDVKALSYINCNWDNIPMFQGQGWGNARIQDNEELKEKWIKEISHPNYLQASPELFSNLDFK